jgi:uncharacterized protein YjiS (DUF1127 family)
VQPPLECTHLQIPDASYANFDLLTPCAMRYIIVQRKRRNAMNIANRIVEFFQLGKAYRELARMDDAALKDIGVSRSDLKRRVYGR